MGVLDNFRMAIGLKTKIVEPKIYVLLLAIENQPRQIEEFLHICVQHTLEDAFASAMEALKRAMPNRMDYQFWQVKMRVFITMDELMRLLTEVKVEEAEVPKNKDTEKNKLMLEIVTNGDRLLFEKHKAEFNENEQAFLLDRLTKQS